MKKLKISVCMIVKNEEKHIEKCLKSIINKVDEIVIVDTGSTDTTIDIAKKYTNKIFHYSWDNSFSKARNYSLSFATGDYILILDADEFLETDENLKMNINKKVDCYNVRINNIQSNGSFYYHHAYRIFKNNIGISYENPLHEQLKLSKGKKYIIKDFSIPIFHDGYLDEVQVEKNKRQRNIMILEKDILNNRNSYNLYNLGRENFILGNYIEALNLFNESKKINENTLFTPDLFNRIAICLLNLNRKIDFINFIEKAIKKYPKETELFFTAGSGYMKFEEFTKAEKYFFKCIEIGDSGYQVREGIGNYISYLKLSEVFYEIDDLVKSFDYLIKSLEKNSKYVPTLVHYFKVVEKSNIPIADALHTLELFYKIKTKEDLKKLIEVLYHTRSTYLNFFTIKYNVKVEENIQAVIYILNKEYSKATELFKELKSIPKENLKDIFVLSLINRNYTLLNKFLEEDKKDSEIHLTIVKMILFKNQLEIFENSDLKNDIITDFFTEVSVYLANLKQYEEIIELVEKCKKSSCIINKIIQKLLNINEIFIVESLIDNYSESILKNDLSIKTLEKWRLKKERYLLK